jgi:CubicO group peptidase (beta-lactamase class C family)
VNMQPVVPESVGLGSERLSHIADLVQGSIDRGEIAGASTLVMRHGQVAYSACQGLADLATRRPLQEDAIFRIWSMTKPIAVVAALMLYEQGRFGLYDPISRYIPSFANSQVLVKVGECGVETVPAVEGITIKQLMTHTSGLIYPGGEDEVARLWAQSYQQLGESQYDTPTGELVDFVAGLPLAFQPGTQWRYGFSIDILGRLVEVLTGQTFGQYLEEAIFAPLGMVDTAFWVPPEKLGRLTTQYTCDADGVLEASDVPPNSRWARPPAFESGGGGLVSTMHDYARFAQMLLNGGELDGVRILGRKTIALMSSEHLAEDLRSLIGQRGYCFGLGVRVMCNPSEANIPASAGEYGWAGLASTKFWIDPAEDLIGIIMRQLIDNHGYPLSDQFATLMYAALI